MKKPTIATNIKTLMLQNEITAIGIDKALEFPLGTMSKNLFRNHRNIDNGFSVSDIARLMKLFDCSCDAIFYNVDFGKVQNDK